MQKTHETSSVLSWFDQKRRVRRLRMIIDVTDDIIRNSPTLTAREARCLVTCARKAIVELFPIYLVHFDESVRPRFDRVIHERWPIESLHIPASHELVN